MRDVKGSVILEALIAVGVASLYLGGLVSLLMVANAASDRAQQTEQATWNMHEGLAALQTVAFTDLPTTDTGSLSFASGQWTVGASGPVTLPDGMTRTVKVQTVNRDANCLVTTTGGTDDPDSRYLESDVSWTDNAGRVHSASSRSLRTRWDDPQGTCFGATQAMQVTFNVSGAVFSGGKQLRQVFFTNDGGTTVTVDKITMTWNNGAEFDQLFMDTSKVWSSSGPGTPTGSQLTGIELNIADFALPAGTTAELNKGQFNKNMAGVTMTMTVEFTDGSVWTSPAFNPS